MQKPGDIHLVRDVSHYGETQEEVMHRRRGNDRREFLSSRRRYIERRKVTKRCSFKNRRSGYDRRVAFSDRRDYIDRRDRAFFEPDICGQG